MRSGRRDVFSPITEKGIRSHPKRAQGRITNTGNGERLRHAKDTRGRAQGTAVKTEENLEFGNLKRVSVTEPWRGGREQPRGRHTEKLEK